jgi:hypothetical protein
MLLNILLALSRRCVLCCALLLLRLHHHYICNALKASFPRSLTVANRLHANLFMAV